MPLGNFPECIFSGTGQHGIWIHDQPLESIDCAIVLGRHDGPEGVSGSNANVWVGIVGQELDQLIDEGQLMVAHEFSGDFPDLPVVVTQCDLHGVGGLVMPGVQEGLPGPDAGHVGLDGVHPA